MRPELFLSLSGEKTKGSVGWSVANVSKGSCPRSTINSLRHFQTSKGTNTNHFYINQYHPRRPQTPLTKFQKIQILTDFGPGQRSLTPPGGQLATFLSASEAHFLSLYMDRLFRGKRWVPNIERWPSTRRRADLSLSLFREKAKWSVGWSVANVSKGSCPRSTLNTPRHFQT